MNTDIFDTDERTRVVAKDILTACELVKHPNFTYVPSRQLQAILSDYEIATVILHLKQQGAVDVDERHIYSGGHIEPLPSYEVRIANAIVLSVAANPQLLSRPVELIGHTPKPKSKLIVEKVGIHTPLEPRHYANRTGLLTVSPTTDLAVAANGKIKRPGGKKYDQCHLMSCLFKSVNTLNSGVTFNTFLGVKYDKNNKKHVRKIRNTIDEINKKVSEKTTTKKLIFIHGEKIFIDKSYLLE